MISALSILIALNGIFLMGIVLIQNPDGGGIDSTFGGDAQQVIGAARSTNFIEKLTWGLATSLFTLSIITAALVSLSN